MQQWSLTGVFDEYRRFAGNKASERVTERVLVFTPLHRKLTYSLCCCQQVRVLDQQFIELFREPVLFDEVSASEGVGEGWRLRQMSVLALSLYLSLSLPH